MVRGVPWGSAVLLNLKDLRDYEDAQLLKQKLAACFTAFVVETEAPELALGETSLAETLEPGAIELLPPGRDIKFATPPSADGYSDYVKMLLHKIAAGYGITYEALTSDLSQVNYSSGRMGWLEFQRNIETWRWQILIPQMCDPIWRWFVEAAGAGRPQNPLADVSIVWTPPRREMIDPTKEYPATRDAIRSGLKTWSEAVRELGEDPEAVLAELQADAQRLSELGIVLDSDPRQDPQRLAVNQQQSQPG
jgi:lambda family phage portal protein